MIWLLVTSILFYISWNPEFLVLISISTFISYFCALGIDYYGARNDTNAKKCFVALNLIVNLAFLCFFKYANFTLESIDSLCKLLGLGAIDKRLDLLLPVGISFYTFQIIGYTIDVYRGKVKAEHNIIRYATFVTFFPKLISGPIERSDNLLEQLTHIDSTKLWNLARIRDGMLLMAWGYFQKLVIADRLSILTGQVFDNYSDYGSAELLTAIVLFAFQIYCDFGGYTDIARGASQIMGISLIENFRQPYLAVSIRDFWKRWHISLTSWFTQYLYIPLGGNRKGIARKWINIAIVFLVSGLWHGSSWHFIVWGGLHALFQIIEDAKRQRDIQLNKNNRKNGRFRKAVSVVKTFILVDFAWLFFAAHGTRHAVNMIIHLFSLSPATGFLNISYGTEDWMILLAAMLLVFSVDICHERKLAIRKTISGYYLPIRWGLYFGLIWIIILFGIYGQAYDTGNFLYAQF